MGDSQGYNDLPGGWYGAEAGLEMPDASAAPAEQSYDDQFDDGLFGTSLHASIRARPNQWPKSVSEMQRLTSYADQGMHLGHDTDHGRYQMPRTGQTAQMGQAASAQHPYYKGQWFWKRPSRDVASTRGGGVWNGYLGQKYYDNNRGWVWIDSNSRPW